MFEPKDPAAKGVPTRRQNHLPAYTARLRLALFPLRASGNWSFSLHALLELPQREQPVEETRGPVPTLAASGPVNEAISCNTESSKRVSGLKSLM